tara:strand:- start:1070 stop:1417 length:348 start_codon:yes stop_codon:yes gene_type:complete
MKTITITYNRNPKSSSRIDSCTDVGITFNGQTLNVMPTPTEVYFNFDISEGVEETLDDIVGIMGKKKYRSVYNFNVKVVENDCIDNFSFIGTPIYYRIPDTSQPTTEMVLAVCND